MASARMVPVLARAAVAAGVAGLFMETHPNPDQAKSDGPNSWPLNLMPALLAELKALDEIVKAHPFLEEPSAGEREGAPLAYKDSAGEREGAPPAHKSPTGEHEGTPPTYKGIAPESARGHPPHTKAQPRRREGTPPEYKGPNRQTG